METLINNREMAIVNILSVYTNLSADSLINLIHLTNGITGVSFVSINGYSSDKSNNTEIANQVINIGASYENMLQKDENIFAKVDLSTIDVNRFDYSTIDTGVYTLEQYKEEVKRMLPVALAELLEPKKNKDTSADIWLNRALVFNLHTMRLSIFGMQQNKTIEIKGQFKVVKSAPKTVAKRLIEKQANGRTATLRRFALDNLIGTINLKGETIEID